MVLLVSLPPGICSASVLCRNTMPLVELVRCIKHTHLGHQSCRTIAVFRPPSLPDILAHHQQPPFMSMAASLWPQSTPFGAMPLLPGLLNPQPAFSGGILNGIVISPDDSGSGALHMRLVREIFRIQQALVGLTPSQRCHPCFVTPKECLRSEGSR